MSLMKKFNLWITCSMKRFVLMCLTLLFIAAGINYPQIKQLKKLIPKNIPGLEKILQAEPAITTSFEDAVFGIPFLDDFNPTEFVPIDSLNQSPDGGLEFHPGVYQFDVQSFCLKTATFGPRGGSSEGYLFAPIKGPRADIVSNVIARSFDHPEIDHKDIQLILWAIISYTKFSDMPRRKQLIAAKLLTPEELYELNGEAFGLIPEKLMGSALKKLHPDVRKTVIANTRLRRMLTKSRTRYEDLERVAVLTGESPQNEEENIPIGRWSLRPDGFFIRYFPYNYKRIRVEIYNPEYFLIEWDELGRLTSLADEKGNFIRTDYDDSLEAVSVAGEPSLKGFAFRSIRFGSKISSDQERDLLLELNQSGWTFVGVPDGTGRIRDLSSDRFSDLKDRYEWALEHKEQIERLDEQFKPKGSLDVLIDIGHYSKALDSILAEESNANKKTIAGHLNLAKKAWQFALWLREMYSDDSDEYQYAPIGNDAVPRKSYKKQRLKLKMRVKEWNKWNMKNFPWIEVERKWEMPILREPRKPMVIAGVVR